ncbi:hypothetical protein TrLO_g9011 [Triparma laevis f. longispina]|uniref:Peptidase M14 domain-containing protein n=1 Tax=Triparma laevis f. longispina TaxID=1714387 RepID=A0A9W7FEJ0_9STRA|nr:hypothetical protein TrLO_g9011 [Triparma laevis f. longispina]
MSALSKSKKTFPQIPDPAPLSGPVAISSNFCGGNIVHTATIVESPTKCRVELNVDQDPYTELEDTIHSQWFYFKGSLMDPILGGPNKGEEVTVDYVITNANRVAFPSAWPGSSVCVSTNGKKSWERKTKTDYDKAEGTLSWQHVHRQYEEGTYFSFFEPYTLDRHIDLVDRCRATRGVNVSVIGRSLENRDIELITVGTGPLKCWINHRQHPGETQAEFFAEGLLTRLCGLDDFGAVDGLAHKAREAFTFYIVPNINPDGSANGYLRTNAGGANLNREWATTGDYEAPTLERSPEVYYVLKKMDEVGVDAFADIHGDEEMPFNFIAGAEGCTNWGPRLQGLQGAFLGAYCRTNPDMQKEVSYDPEDPNGANLAVCSNQIATRFNCLSITLEMPYKDCYTCPDPERGFTGGRCARLGMNIVDAFMHVKDWLRSEEPFWENLGEDDQYIRPKEEWEGKATMMGQE